MSCKNGDQIRSVVWHLSQLMEDVDSQDREIYAHGGPAELEAHCREVLARRWAEIHAQEEGLSWEQ